MLQFCDRYMLEAESQNRHSSAIPQRLRETGALNGELASHENAEQAGRASRHLVQVQACRALQRGSAASRETAASGRFGAPEQRRGPNPVSLAVFAIDHVGPAAVRACASGIEVQIAAEDEATAAVIRAALSKRRVIARPTA